MGLPAWNYEPEFGDLYHGSDVAHGAIVLLPLFAVTYKAAVKADADCISEEFFVKVSEASCGAMEPPAFGRQRQKDDKFEAPTGHVKT